MVRILSLTLCALLLISAAHAQTDPDSAQLDFDNSQFAPPPERAAPTKLTLMFTGDTKLCGRTAQQMARHGSSYPFARVVGVLRSADLCFGNCETAITDHPTSTPGKSAESIRAMRNFVFRCDPGTSGAMFADAGFDVLQLANNHAMDYCAEGLAETLVCLDAAGIAHVGAGMNYAAASAPRIVELEGVRIGFLAYSLILPLHSAARRDSAGINYVSDDYDPLLRRHIGDLRAQADYVVVGFHWGREGHTVPNRLQRSVGRAAINAGADLVIGTHTHTLQGVEHYGGGVIAYSLGNFVFTGASQLLTGGILRITVEHDGTTARTAETALLPCWIKDGVPTPAADQRLLGKVAAVMQATGSQLRPLDDPWLRIEPAP